MKKLLLFSILLFLFNINLLSSNSFHFVVLSDRTGNPNHEEFVKIINEIVLLNPDFIVTVGDLVNNASEEEYIEIMELMNTVDIPIFYTPGNHDIRNQESEKLFTKYTGFNPYHSFNYMNSHFIVLDNSRARNYQSMGEEQIEWFKKDLEKSKDYKNKFVFMHKPFWGNEIHDGKDDFMHDLYKKYNISGVYTGHWHQFAHDEIDGIRYYLAGSSGGGFGAENIDLGMFYQYLWVSVNDDKITTSVIKSGNVFKDDIVNMSEEKMIYNIGENYVKINGFAKDKIADINYSIKNESKNSLTEPLNFLSVDNWIFKKSKIELNIAPKQEAIGSYSILNSGSFYPLPSYSYKYKFGRDKVIELKKPIVMIREFDFQNNNQVEIDGSLTKEEKKNSIKIADWCNSEGEKSIIDSTELFISIKDKDFYIGINAFESNVENIVSNTIERDADIFSDDIFGILIAQDGETIYQFFVNTLGTIWDMKMNQKTRDYNKEWNGNIKVENEIVDNQLIFEISIPTSELDFDLSKPILLNMRRYQQAKEASGILSPSWNLNVDNYLRFHFKPKK